MLMILLIGLALSYHWPEPVAEKEHAEAEGTGHWPRPIGPLICTGDAAFRDADAPAKKPDSDALEAGLPGMGSNAQVQAGPAGFMAGIAPATES